MTTERIRDLVFRSTGTRVGEKKLRELLLEGGLQETSEGWVNHV